jgi:hypothetical protein
MPIFIFIIYIFCSKLISKIVKIEDFKALFSILLIISTILPTIPGFFFLAAMIAGLSG